MLLEVLDQLPHQHYHHLRSQGAVVLELSSQRAIFCLNHTEYKKKWLSVSKRLRVSSVSAHKGHCRITYALFIYDSEKFEPCRCYWGWEHVSHFAVKADR